MPEFVIYWNGTVSGQTFVEADTLEEAIKIAEEDDQSIDINEYPTDWEIDEGFTRFMADED